MLSARIAQKPPTLIVLTAASVPPAIEITTDVEPGSIQGIIDPANFTFEDVIDATSANRNLISMNSFWDNAGQAIQLVGDPDKDDDGEHGIGCNQFPNQPSPNDCIQAPVIQTQSGDKLVGLACSDCHIEVYMADTTPNDQPLLGPQFGEGLTYLVTVTANGAGEWSADLPCDLDGGELTATATDKIKNTSEFSENKITLGTGTCATDTPVATDTGHGLGGGIQHRDQR